MNLLQNIFNEQPIIFNLLFDTTGGQQHPPVRPRQPLQQPRPQRAAKPSGGNTKTKPLTKRNISRTKAPQKSAVSAPTKKFVSSERSQNQRHVVENDTNKPVSNNYSVTAPSKESPSPPAPARETSEAPSTSAPASDPVAAEKILERTFFDAVIQGKINVLKNFLSRNPSFDVNMTRTESDRRRPVRNGREFPRTTSGWKALHFCAWSDDDETAVFLLERGADPTLKSIRSQTPLHVAVRNDSHKVAELLIRHVQKSSSDASTYIHMTNPLRNHQTAMEFCCIKDASQVAQILLDHGGKPNSMDQLIKLASRTMSYKTLLVLMPYVDASQLSQYELERMFHRSVVNNATDLIANLRPRITRPRVFAELATYALRSDDIPTARKWFKEADELAKKTRSKIDLQEGHYAGDTAWQVAVEKENQEMLQLCYEIDGTNSIHVGELFGWSKPPPLVMAAKAGAVACVETLLRFGAQPWRGFPLPAIVSGTNETDYRHQECMDIILSKALSPLESAQALTAANAKGFNFLHLAAMNGHIQLFKRAAEILRNAGDAMLRAARVESPTGMNLLALAASKGHYDIVSLALDMLKFPISSTSSAKPGWQAIHFASAAGHDRIVDLLASKGADVNAQTHDDQTPASLAQKSGYSAVVSVLKNYGANVVSMVEEQLKMIAETTKTSSVRLMSFNDEVPAHLNYPQDVRSLASNDASNSSYNSSTSGANAAKPAASHRHQSANMPWRTARLFISSTFEDMHAERNYLVKFVLPHLKKACLERRIHLIEVDLRWGVTAEEAQSGKALEICLSQVDQCDIFVALIGNRYGWVPSKTEVPADIAARYEWQDGYSVTHMEVFRAALRKRSPADAQHACFFIRDGSEAIAAALPFAQLRNAFDESDASKKAKVNQLKQDLQQRFSAQRYKAKFQEMDKDGKPVLSGLTEFGQQFYSEVWSRIEKQFPIENLEDVDDLVIEQKYHDEYMEQKTRTFVGRTAQMEALSKYLDSSSQHVPLLVTGDAGSGKSALLANFVKHQRDNGPVSLNVVYHFVGASPMSTNPRHMLWFICASIAKTCGLFTPVDDGADFDALEKTLQELLAEFGKSQPSSKLLIVIEALNQLDSTTASRVHELSWVAAALPKNVKMILSTLPNSQAAKVLEGRKTPSSNVGGLNEHDRAEIVTEILSKYNKRLDDTQMRHLLSKADAMKPLFLSAACEELRVFGIFEKLTQKIRDMPTQLYELIQSMVKRVEADHGPAVSDFLSLLFLSKSGLLETEISELLSLKNASHLTSLLLALEIFTRRVGKEQSLDFAHRQFAKASAKMFFESANGSSIKMKYQRQLAMFYLNKYKQSEGHHPASKAAEPEPRAVSHVVHYCISAGLADETERLLTSLRYLRRRCHLGQVYELVADLQAALNAFSSSSWNAQQVSRIQRFASFIQSNVYLFAGQPELLLQQALNSAGSIRQAGEAELRSSASSGVQEKFIRWINNVNDDSDSSGSSGAVLLVAMDAKTDVNDVCWSPHDGGQSLLSSHRDGSISIWNRRTGEELSRMSGAHSDRVNAVEFIRPQGQFFASGAADKKFKIYDTNSRQVVATHTSPASVLCLDCVQVGGVFVFAVGCEDGAIRIYHGTHPNNLTVQTLNDAHPSGVTTVRLDFDSSSIFLASGGINKQIKFWKSPISSIKFSATATAATAHTKPVKEIKIFNYNSKRYIVSSSQDKSLKVWNWDTSSAICSIDANGDNVETCDVAVRNGKVLILSGSWDRSVRVFSLDATLSRAEQIASLPSISHFVNAVSFSPDNANAILVGSPDHTARIFSTDAAIAASSKGISASTSAKSGSTKPLFNIHSKMIRGLAYDPVSKLLATGSWDNTACIMRVSGTAGSTKLEKVKTITGHTKRVNIVAWASPTQSGGPSTLVTSSMDQLVKTWNADSGAPLKTFKGHKSNVFVVATSHDGRYIASASSDTKVMIWNNDSGKSASRDKADGLVGVLDAHSDWATAVAFSPLSRRLATASRDAQIKIWNSESGEELETLRGHEACVLQVVYSHDGKLIASASEDRTVRLWDAFTLKCLAVMRGHAHELTSCHFLRGPQGHILVTGSSDKTIRFWNCKTQSCVWTYFCDSGVTSIDSTADGQVLFVGESAGNVHVLDLSVMKWD